MKKYALLILITLFSNVAFADKACDWSTIKQLPDGGYEYSATLNLCVGKLVQDSKVKDAQIADLTQAVQLKDLALVKADTRTQLWLDTSDKLQNRLSTVDTMEKHNEWLMFGLGALTVIGAGYMTSKLLHP
jgi:hypothetical protein